MKEGRFHSKITWFTCVFSLLVVWTHSYNAELLLGAGALLDHINRIQHIFGQDIAQIAVPGFFMMSSYLFFRNYSPSQLWRKWNGRIRSLLVPYILWNGIYYLGYVLATHISGLREIVGKGIIPLGLIQAGDAILHYTYNYTFWYLWQLILLVALAPVLYYIIRNRIWGILLLAILMAGIHFQMEIPLVNLDALFYYSAAGMAAIHGRSVVEGEREKPELILGIIMILLGTMCIIMAYRGISVLLTVLGRFLIPAGMWLLVDLKSVPLPYFWARDNFFLYAIHFAIVRLINKTAAMLLPEGEGRVAVCLILFLGMPVLLKVISTVASIPIKSHLPGIWRWLNGGRDMKLQNSKDLHGA